MKEYQSLSHARWDCKYHVVFIPKRRKSRIFGVLRKHPGEIFHDLASQKESKIVEGHLMSDHVHICIRISPKYAVSNVTGYIKGKNAIQIVGNLGDGRETSQARISGPEGTSYRRLDWMRRWLTRISHRMNEPSLVI
jgi:putative transposase